MNPIEIEEKYNLPRNSVTITEFPNGEIEIDYGNSLQGVKAKKIVEISDLCKNNYNSDLVSSDGIPFRAHLEAIMDVQAIIDMLEPEGVYEGYKGPDDVYRDITREQFQTALNEGKIRKMQSFAKRKFLTDLILNSESIEEAESISW